MQEYKIIQNTHYTESIFIVNILIMQSLYNGLLNSISYVCMYVCMYAKQKQPGAVKKGATKQSRINSITEYDW